MKRRGRREFEWPIDVLESPPPPILLSRSPSPKRKRGCLALEGWALIGTGAEACVYRQQGSDLVRKQFKRPFIAERLTRNIDFLVDNGDNGLVPEFRAANVAEGWIEMSYLEGFTNLEEYKKKNSQVLRDRVEDLAIALYTSRYCLLPQLVDYADLDRLPNIAIRVNQDIAIKFYEGGKPEFLGQRARRRTRQANLTRNWVDQVLGRLGLANKRAVKTLDTLEDVWCADKK